MSSIDESVARAPRRTWKQAEIVALVSAYNAGGVEAATKACAWNRAESEVRAKLEALGLLTLDAAKKATITKACAAIRADGPLAVKLALSELRKGAP